MAISSHIPVIRYQISTKHLINTVEEWTKVKTGWIVYCFNCFYGIKRKTDNIILANSKQRKTASSFICGVLLILCDRLRRTEK